MQYILSEEEIKRGKRLIESWRIVKLTLEQARDESDNLNSQGWYTVVHNPDEENVDEFEVIVYGFA